jgi:polar amino acid transport system substrate-binding protein
VVSDVVADLAPRGFLRASINLGNPVLAQGTPGEPAGVTVDIARELAARLGVPVEFVCFDAARKSFEALLSGTADICFLAIEPARAAEVAFSAPYVLIEGVYVVPDGSPLVTAEDADQDGIRIGVKEGSAYDLYLSRTLRHATVVRGGEGTDVFIDGNLDAGAGIREPATEFVASRPGYRLLDGRFMEIRQAVGTAKAKHPETVRFIGETVEDLKRSGFIAESLRRSGQTAPVAPLALPAEPA